MSESVTHTKPRIFQDFPGLLAIETTRHGGASQVPYASLNLGKNTDDQPENIAKNREIITQDLGIRWDQVAFGKQVHGSDVLHAQAPGYYEGYDAFITNTEGLALSVTVADCAPIMIFDPTHQACGVAHAGWRGAAARIGTRTLAAMSEQFGTRSQDCLVYVGTCIGYDEFEVGAEVVAEFDATFWRKGKAAGKYFLDLKSAIAAEFGLAGVPEQQVEISKWCTVRDNAQYFSHRKENGVTGRFAILMGTF
jgi:polyphenol oxidase